MKKYGVQYVESRPGCFKVYYSKVFNTAEQAEKHLAATFNGEPDTHARVIGLEQFDEYAVAYAIEELYYEGYFERFKDAFEAGNGKLNLFDIFLSAAQDIVALCDPFYLLQDVKKFLILTDRKR